MPTYAVKIGEIHLEADKPITEEMRKALLAEFRQDPGFCEPLSVAEGVQLRFAIPKD